MFFEQNYYHLNFLHCFSIMEFLLDYLMLPKTPWLLSIFLVALNSIVMAKFLFFGIMNALLQLILL